MASLWMSSSFLAELIVLDDPMEMARHLCEQMRELTGAKTVAFFLHADDTDTPCTPAHVSPPRRAKLFEDNRYHWLCPKCHPEPIPFLTEEITEQEPLYEPLTKQGIHNLLRLPILNDDTLFGSFILTDLPDPEHVEEIQTMMDFLAPTLGLTIQSGLARRELEQQREHLEQLVEQRTTELEASNRELDESRRAALNMMEDSILSAKKLEFEHNLFTSFMDTVPASVYFKDTDSAFVSVNTTLADRFNLSPDEIIGKSDRDFFPEDQAAQKRADEQNVMQTGRTIDIEERIGSIWQHTIKAPRYDESGQIIGIYGISWDITERKQAREALRKNEEHLRTTLNSIGDAVISVDTNETISSINRVAEQLTGWPHNEAIGLPISRILTLIDEQTLKPITIPIGSTLADGVISNLPTSALMLSKDGRTIPINDSCAPILNAAGDITGAVLVFRDQTAEREARRALEQSEANLKRAQMIANIGNWELNLNTHQLTWSEEVFHIFEEDPARFTPTPSALLEKVHPDDRAALLASWEEARNTFQPGSIEHRIILADGRIKFVMVQSEIIPDAAGNPGMAIGTIQDITRRKKSQRALEQSQQQLQRSNELLHAILNAVPARIFWKDRNGTYLGCNTAFAQDAGAANPDEIIGKSDHQIAWSKGKAETYRNADRDIITTGTPVLQREELRSTASGHPFWAEINKVPLTDTHDNIIGILGTYQDISERKRMQAAIEQRLVALTRPLEDTPCILHFEDLFNLGEIQRIQDEFSKATGVASIITTPDGAPITRASHFTHFCTLCRSTQKGRANCQKSDATLGRHCTLGPHIQPCLSGGLWDAGVSIEVGGRHIANWVIGQVRDETQTEKKVRSYARKIGVDEGELVDAFFDVPSMPKDQFESVATALYTLVNQISISAYQNLQQARFIADQKKTETALRESTDYLEAMWSAIDIGIMLIDAEDRTILRVNPTLLRISGYTEKELLNTRCHHLVCPADEKNCPIGNLGQTVDKSVRILLHKDGHEIQVEKTVTPITLNDRKVYIETLIDITERLKAEQELRRLSTAIDQSPETILMTDTQGVILYVNPAFERSTGFSREEAIGCTPSILNSGLHNDAFYKKMWTTLEQGSIWEGRLTNRKKDGTLYTEEVSIAPVRRPDGLITHYVAVKRDITKDLLHDEQLKQAQKMEAVGQLAGGIAHDFNNILQAILGFSELLMVTMDNASPQQRSNVIEIQNAAKHAADLTKQLLMFSRKEQGALEPTDLNLIVTNTLSFIGSIAGENIRICSELHDSALPILADARQLERAILNMAINARDAMPHGGTLTLSTQTVSFSADAAAANPKIHAGDFACLRIADTGIGMSQKIMEHIFEPFFSTKGPGKGTGLGLAAFYGIIQEHKGWINVYSEVGEGSVFHIYLPLNNNEPAGKQSARPEKSAIKKQGQGQTILLVEDDPAIRTMANDVLTKTGYNIVCASDAESAEEEFHRRNGEFSLMISDYILPNKTGGELATILTEIKPDLPVIICSGYAGDRVNREFLEQKGFFFLEKPYSIVNLLALVQKIFRTPE